MIGKIFSKGNIFKGHVIQLASFYPGDIKICGCDHIINFVSLRNKKTAKAYQIISLDNIQLPSFIIPGLFGNNLVEVSDIKTKTATPLSGNISYLGGNKQQIILMIKNEDAAYLTDRQMKFLTGILDAC